KSLEEAFIGYMEDAIESGHTPPSKTKVEPEKKAAPKKERGLPLPVRRMLAYSRNEAIQILRDPIRLMFAFVGSALLMLVFGFGITTDVEHIRYATFDHDHTPESREYLAQFSGAPTYFHGMPAVYSDDEALERLQSDDVSLVVEIPPSFGRDTRRGRAPQVSASVD